MPIQYNMVFTHNTKVLVQVHVAARVRTHSLTQSLTYDLWIITTRIFPRHIVPVAFDCIS